MIIMMIKMQKIPRPCLVPQSFLPEVTAVKVVCCIYVCLYRRFLFNVICVNKRSIFMFQNSKSIKWCTVKVLTPTVSPMLPSTLSSNNQC